MEPTEPIVPRKPRLQPDAAPLPPPEAEPERKRYGFKPSSIQKVNTSDLPPVDVYDLLQTNLRAQANPAKPLPEPPRSAYRWRRTRDYWMLMVSVNLGFAAAAYFGRSNPIVWTFALSGLVLFDIGFTWVMWFVLDRH